MFGRKVDASTMKRRVFPAWAGNQFTPGDGPAQGIGTAVYPSIREGVQSGRIAAEYSDHIMNALASAFPETA